MTIRTIDHSDQWPLGLLTIRTNDYSDHYPSDHWPFGLMSLRTINHSDQWPFGLLTIRTNDHSKYRPVTILNVALCHGLMRHILSRINSLQVSDEIIPSNMQVLNTSWWFILWTFPVISCQNLLKWYWWHIVDRQQSITQSNDDQILGSRYQSVTKA